MLEKSTGAASSYLMHSKGNADDCESPIQVVFSSFLAILDELFEAIGQGNLMLPGWTCWFTSAGSVTLHVDRAHAAKNWLARQRKPTCVYFPGCIVHTLCQ